MAVKSTRVNNFLETDDAGGFRADTIAGSVVALAFDFPAGYEVAPHRHRRAQLVFAAGGVVTATSREGSWVLPTARALWVPPGVEHSLRMTGAVRLRTVYFEPAAIDSPLARSEVLSVSGLLRELVLRAVEVGPVLRNGSPADASSALVDLLIEEILSAQREPHEALRLPDGRDSRLRRLTDGLRADPADPSTLSEWGSRVGASERTLARLFLAETSLTFGRWRQQLRLQRALELLAAGRSVSRVAGEVGYESLSAFITMFHRATGYTPSSYFGGSGR